MTAPKVDPAARRMFNEQQTELASLPIAGVECRANGHYWRPRTAGQVGRGGWDLSQQCANCKSVRRQILDRYGLLVQNPSYEYSEDFEVMRGLGRNSGVRKGAARIEAVTRNLIALPAAEAGA